MFSFKRECYCSFLSMVRILKEGCPQHLIEITMSGPFSVVDAWSYSMTYAGREGNKNLNIPNDPGLSEGQAAPVYSLLDQAFVTTFPGLDALTRTEMAECTKQLFYKTFAVLGKRDTANPLKEKDLLLKFSEEVVRLLEPAKVI